MSESPERAGIVNRTAEANYVLQAAGAAECCSILGISNVGKSTFMRSLPDLAESEVVPAQSSRKMIYVDFNLISQMTEQGFYEVVLRSLLLTLEGESHGEGLPELLRSAYQTVVAPSSPFAVPLAFEDALAAFVARSKGVLVLLFDEFDEPLAELDPRLFVRLRALKDRYWWRLCFVTATDRPLPQIRSDRQVGEFCELFAARTRYILPLSRTDARVLLGRTLQQSRSSLGDADVDLALDCADGHPALLLAASRGLVRLREEAAWRSRPSLPASLCELLASESSVRLECAKIWNDLATEEREALLGLVGGSEAGLASEALREKGVVRSTPTGSQIFCDLFAGFVRRQKLVLEGGTRGVRVDVESGDVWVDGELVPALTDLEYRLLLLLYGNLDKICDKYRIVESVWGDEYIDQVDDARIEKLISRLRQKLEPDAEQPRYVVTIRGRGYKLLGASEALSA